MNLEERLLTEGLVVLPGTKSNQSKIGKLRRKLERKGYVVYVGYDKIAKVIIVQLDLTARFAIGYLKNIF